MSLFDRQTGLIMIGKTGSDIIDGTVRALRKHSVPFTALDHDAMEDKYPMLRYPRDMVGVVDHSGGVLFADKALAAFQVHMARCLPKVLTECTSDLQTV